MRIEITAAPDIEPITVAQAKLNTRIDLDADDTIVARLISSSRQFIENYCNNALIEQTRIIYYDRCDLNLLRQKITLPFQPIMTIEEFNSYNSDNTEALFSDDNYFLSGRRICLNDNCFWPSDIRNFDSFAIEVTCGFGDEADSVPTPILEAMYKLIAHGYENREAFFDPMKPVPSYANVPWSITSMLQPYRIITIG